MNKNKCFCFLKRFIFICGSSSKVTSAHLASQKQWKNFQNYTLIINFRKTTVSYTLVKSIFVYIYFMLNYKKGVGGVTEDRRQGNVLKTLFCSIIFEKCKSLRNIYFLLDYTYFFHSLESLQLMHWVFQLFLYQTQ